MPFVSNKDEKQYLFSGRLQDKAEEKSTFGDTFQAAVGLFIDEDMSISSLLNREAWSLRKEIVDDYVKNGQLEKSKYLRKTSYGSSVFDYNLAAKDFDDIKSDADLELERTEMLRNRREYAEDIISRGPFLARALGTMNSALLDPISIATMPIGYSVSGVKGLAAVGQAMMKAGAVEGATELGIQAFVMQHKSDIKSDYDWTDALANIAAAATGASLLSGGAVGIKEYLGRVLSKASDLPLDGKAIMGAEPIARMKETLESNPLRKPGMSSKELIDADVKYLEGLESRRVEVSRSSVEAPEIIKLDGDSGLSTKERAVLDKIGRSEDFSQDMIKYRNRFPQPKPVEPKLKGIQVEEKVRVKETGEIVSLKGEADIIYRRAKKRKSRVQDLRRCLGA